MCGRFAFYSPHEAVIRLFGVAAAPEVEPRWNIAPTQFIATLREPGGPREVAMLYWGLVPSWAKDPSLGSRLINARVETVADKPAFRKAFAARRCLLPADGYFEWYPTEQLTARGKPPAASADSRRRRHRHL